MHFHVLAIGGIGMSGIARMLMQLGHTVSGNDMAHSYIIDKLKEEGVVFEKLQKIVKRQKVDGVVTSSAIKPDDPELVVARQFNIPVYHRAEMLKRIVEGKRVIGVTGAHGKTTSTALLAWILSKLGYEPSAYIGGVLKQIGLNAWIGMGEFAILELDESDGSFSLFSPEVMFITNLDLEHVDFYQNRAMLISYFRNYIYKAVQTRFVLGFNSKITVEELGIDKIWSLDRFPRFSPVDYQVLDNFLMRVVIADNSTGELFWAKLPLVGRHNLYNICGVLSICDLLGISVKEALSSLESFPGVERRMDIYVYSPTTVIHDYAHHPEEIRATLSTIRTVIGQRRLLAVFEPHRYTRFSALWEEFKGAFSTADLVFCTPVYSAAEEEIEDVNSDRFCSQLKQPAIALPEYKLGPILETVKEGDCVVFLGAGKIVYLAKEFAHECTSNIASS